MGQFGVGQAVRRKEDNRLVVGGGRYTDDVADKGQLCAMFVRSPHAHASITRIDADAARALPGVHMVVTGDDLVAAGLGPMPCKFPLVNRDGSDLHVPERPILARGRVRFVGDPVVMVVADTAAIARDAMEQIQIDYEPLPAIVDLVAAHRPDAPRIWAERPLNEAFDWEDGDAAKVDALIARAARTVELEIVNNRVVPNSLEARGAVASYDEASDRLTLHTGGQGVHGMRAILAEDILRIDPSKLRVIQADVGGGFGMKIWVYPEYPSVLHAARTLKRPVKWISERSEAFLADTHGRDHVTKLTVALDADNRMTALKAQVLANLGGYLSQYAPFIPTACGSAMYAGVYTFEAVHFHVHGIYTNTAPVDAYRGAGRPEAAYAVERVVDATARAIGMDPVEFRKKNFIPPEAMPYTTPMKVTYDTGEFARVMDSALARADVAGFPARKASALKDGKLLGLGIAYYIEQCSGGGEERARISIGGDGRIQLFIGTQSNGQGHDTAYSQIINEHLGLDIDAIEMIQGDTDKVATGSGTGGSRSVPVGGAATVKASEAIIEKARKIAADMLEAAEADIAFSDGQFTVVGTDRSVGLIDVAGRAGPEGLDATEGWTPPSGTFPNGCHICEISIDIGTGAPQIERYTIVDDFGKVINPLLLEGQVHGGVAQGVGQALYENTVYDTDSGQLVTGSFMDYCMPRADYMPQNIDFSTVEVICTTNLLGMKGAGEAGSIGSCPAIMNGLVDALKDYGITNVDMPATPARLWALIHEKGISAAA